jgi:hypothetical protein
MRNRGGLRIPSRGAKHDAMSPAPDLEVSMKFDPEEGIADLDEHLDTLKRAAEAQGFKFDRHAARNELQAATFGKSRNAIARLLLSPTGAMAIEVTPAD